MYNENKKTMKILFGITAIVGLINAYLHMHNWPAVIGWICSSINALSVYILLNRE